jgi:hypothetical protein
MRNIGIALSLALALAACSDETQDPTTDAGDTSQEVGEDTTPDVEADAEADVESDATPDAEADASEDVEEDTFTPPVCVEEIGERLVGRECVRDTNRVCLGEDDCRDDETCDLSALDDDGYGTCLYEIPEPIACPGDEGCAEAEAPLRAGFAQRVITPIGFEEAREGFVNEDGLFEGDTEDPETYWDCGRDMICPEDDDYVGPDADGTEGNEEFDGAWIAGFDHSRPAFRCPAELLGDGCEGPDCCANELAHDDVLAVAVVFDQGNSRVAMVTIDTVGYFYSEIQRIRAMLPEELGIDLLIVAATHTHEGPDTLGQWGPGFLGGDLPDLSGAHPLHMAYIREQIVAAVGEAVAELEPVDLYATVVDTGGPGFAIRDSRDPYIIDDDLAVLHAVSAGGDRNDPEDTVGVIVNWGNHPEAISDRNPHISSDFPHYVRHYVAEGLPEVMNGETVVPALEGLGGPVAYFSAAVGGLITPLGRAAIGRDGTVYDSTSWAKVDAMGQRIAEVALIGLSDAPQVEGDLSFRMHEFVTAINNLQFHTAFLGLDLFDRNIVNWRHSDGLGEANPPLVVTAVAGVQIGSVTFTTVPGEIFPEVFVGGFLEGDSGATPIRGDEGNPNCGADLLPPANPDDPDATNPCLIDPTNPNPPNLDEAPNQGFLKDIIPGDTIFLLGLGMDELGYIVPNYDYILDEGAPYVAEADGDHYEETNSVGPNIYDDVIENLTILWSLEGPVVERVEE